MDNSYRQAAEQREANDAWFGDPREEAIETVPAQRAFIACPHCGAQIIDNSGGPHPCAYCGRPNDDDATETDEHGQIRLGHEGEQRGLPGLSAGPEPAPTLDSAHG